MSVKIREIKARCPDLDGARRILRALQPRFVGTDYQIDHYFKVSRGRLKLRRGQIEKKLIHYHRRNQAGPKLSEVILYPCADPETLERLLSAALDTLVIVEKQREIYFLDNVKIHLDTVKNLGTFIEIEAIASNPRYSDRELRSQCQRLMDRLQIKKEHLIKVSYSDMLLKKVTTS